MFGKFNDSSTSQEVLPVADVEDQDDHAENDQDSETDENDEDTSSESTTENDDGAEDNTEETGDTEKKTGFDKRVSKLTKRISDKDREIERLRALVPQQQVERQAQTVGKPELKDFESAESYMDALTDWKLDERERVRDEAKQNQEVGDTYNNRLETYKESNPSYEEDYQDFMDHVGSKAPMTEVIQMMIGSDVGPAMAHYLFKNLNEFDRIEKLSPLRRVAELGKIEDKLLAKTKSVPVVKSKAPPVLTSVKGSGKVETTRISDDDDYETFVKKREKHLQRK